MWNLENMLPILTLQRHEKAVHSLAVWQDFVFTGSEDMEIKVSLADPSSRAATIKSLLRLIAGVQTFQTVKNYTY